MAVYDLTQSTPTEFKTGDIINVPYSGTYKAITLPKGVYKLEVWGAQGGSYSSYYGGKGGYSYGTLTLEEDTTLNCYAGGQPATNSSSRGATSGGYNGGGNGFNRYYSSTYTYGQGGGGGSDIRINSTSLYARVIVAGGGGGSASVDAQTTKYGGGTSGGSPQSGYGASQTGAGTNGSFGTGGAATTSGNNYKYGSGGGGGGWYGGGACTSYSDSTNYRGYNGGGSGYVYTSSTASNYPSGCLLTSAYYLTDAATIAGNTSFTDYSGSTVTGHSGNGCVRITVVKIGTPLRVKKAVDYTELSYIESTGTQCIDTNINTNQNTRIVMDATILSVANSDGAYFFGSMTAHNSTGIEAFTWDTIFYGCYNKVQYSSGTVLNVGDRITIDFDKNNCTVKRNQIEIVNISIPQADNISTIPLHLFELARENYKGVFRLHSCKIYDDNTLVRDFIPVLDSQGVACLFDKVTGEFYYNAGTGSFIAGEIVGEKTIEVWKNASEVKYKLPNNLTKLAYIEATGVQYIDTEHQWQSNNVKVEMQYSYTSIGTNSLFGSETSTPQYGICAYHLNTTDLAFWVGSSQQLLSQTVTTNLKYNLTTHANNGTFTMNLNNATSSATYSGSVQNGRSLFIFCNNIQSGVSQYSKIKLYSFKMYDNNVLVRDYIPVLDKNGVACLYDKVTGKMFYNKGTGNFAYKRFDYTPVEYIQSTGTQWIDTNWYPSSAEIGELKFVIDATFGTAGSGGWAVSGIGSSGYFFHTGLNSNRQIVYGGGTADVSTGVVYTEKRVVAELDYKAKTMKWTEVDSGKVLVNQSITVNTPTASIGKFYLFAYATAASTIAVPYTGVIYSFKGYKNNVLIHDIIPVIDSDGTVCMFDKITQQFLYNSGTGNFTAKYYPNEELEYLSSDGNSYIDTGFVPNQNTRIDIVTMPLSVDDASANTGFIPYGSATAYNNNAFECYSQSSQYEFNFCTSYSFVGTAKIGELITISHDKNNVTVISDGKLETLTLTNGNFTATYTLTLFGTHRSSVLCGKQRIYSCQIYDNDNLVRDYIPKTDANGTPCMYDKITDKYYYNQGTGTFNGIAKNGHIELPVQHETWTTVKQLYKKTVEDLVVLDYIESTGTQYIDTGFVPSSNTSIDIDIEMTNSGKSNAFYGSRTATKSNSFILFAKSDGTGFNFYYGTTSTVVNSPTGTIIGRFSIQQNSNKVTINGVSSTLPVETFTGTQNMFLFAANTAGAFDTQTDINRIRMCKIYDNGTLVRDYIPVIDTKGVACLYDKVTNQLFYNQGTGAFIAGYKTEFEPETELAFLASTGTQYIDTGFKPNQDTRIVMKAQLTSSTTEAGAFLFGASSR